MESLAIELPSAVRPDRLCMSRVWLTRKQSSIQKVPGVACATNLWHKVKGCWKYMARIEMPKSRSRMQFNLFFDSLSGNLDCYIHVIFMCSTRFHSIDLLGTNVVSPKVFFLAVCRGSRMNM